MRALCIAILLCAVACTKKPAPNAPAAQPTPDTVERTAPKPATVVKPGDPCSGGENK